jgi:hypothetical protein
MGKTDARFAEGQLTVDQWLAVRKEAGSKIDPKTAEVMWTYAYTVDPYGVIPDLSEECRQVGREYFARSPESDIWVCFNDLPDEIRKTLWEMHKSSLAFPAGLFEYCVSKGLARPIHRIEVDGAV